MSSYVARSQEFVSSAKRWQILINLIAAFIVAGPEESPKRKPKAYGCSLKPDL